MVGMMTEELLATGTKTPPKIARLCHEFVMRLNGKQTIYQMIELAGEIEKRGGRPQEPVVYKDKYHGRLMEKVGNRREALRSDCPGPRNILSRAPSACWRPSVTKGSRCIWRAAPTRSMSRRRPRSSV